MCLRSERCLWFGAGVGWRAPRSRSCPAYRTTNGKKARQQMPNWGDFRPIMDWPSATVIRVPSRDFVRTCTDLVWRVQKRSGMTNITFDPSRYSRPPLFTLLGGITLADALHAACPKDAAPTLKKTLQKLDRVRSEAQSAWRVRHRALAPSTEDAAQEVDKVCDRGWSALRARLYAYSLLPKDQYPKAERATELLEQLFPKGLSFTQRIYVEQLAAMDSLLQRIAEDKLEKELAALCGPEFLDNVQKLQPRYRAMVQGGLARGADTPNLSVHLKQLSVAIAEYANKVAASVDRDDAESVRLAVAALAPIDRYREASLRRSSGPASPADPMPDPLPLGDDPASPAVT